MRNDPCDIPEVVPSPPDGWTDEGEFSEYIDGKWIRKPDLGRGDRSAAVVVVQSLLDSFAKKLGGTVLWSWHMLAAPDLLRPDAVMTFPKYSVYQGYLVAPAFLTVDVHAKEESIPGHREKQTQISPRGSSRRITIVRFRPADIRVINRRACSSLPPVLLLVRTLLLAFPGLAYFGAT